jgi:5,10-methylenetetrahydromethanopterin reductase
MSSNGSAPVGLVLGSHIPPEQIPSLSQLAERNGYSELWLAEDYFFTGGISGATAALAATSTIPVGLGIVSAVVRHPALLAMELATIERLHPGRLWPGIGLGVPHWINQMGYHPKSPLTVLRESVTTVGRLLAGENVTFDGKVFKFDAIQLTHLPAAPMPIYMGVIGPKMLRLAGEIADGTVVSVLASPQYVSWLRERVDEGMAEGSKTSHRVATFALYTVDADAAKAKQTLRQTTAFYLAAVPRSALTDVYGIGDELWDMYERGGEDAPALIAREMPDQWVDDLAIAGDPDECAAKIQALLDAGSDSVALFPMPVDRTAEIVEMTARDVLPKVTSRSRA